MTSSPDSSNEIAIQNLEVVLQKALDPLISRLENLEARHLQLNLGLENFLKQLKDELNTRRQASPLHEQLERLTEALIMTSFHVQQQKNSEQQLITSIKQLTQMLNKNPPNNC